MPTAEEVIAYIKQLPNADDFERLPEDIQSKHVFSATETLKGYYGANTKVSLNERVIALQTLYMIEGDAEEFAKLKRHGVSNYSVKDVSVALEGASDIPDYILVILNQLNPTVARRGRVGRLI